MFKRILAPMDGSEKAERVLPWLKRYAGPDKAEVMLLRVVGVRPGEFEPLQADLEEAGSYLQGIERELNFAGVPAKVMVKTGNVAATIVRSAVRLQCELIVIATRGGSPVARWVVGGTTEQVMRASNVPVLVVRSGTPLPRQGRVRRVIVPLDASTLAESVLPWAERLARFHRARLIFLHINPEVTTAPRTWRDETYHGLKQRILPICQELRQRGVRTEFRLGRGDAAFEILRTSGPGDLIAMTTHGYGGFKRWMFGSVAEKVIHAAKVPVFVYRSLSTVVKAKPRPMVAITS